MFTKAHFKKYFVDTCSDWCREKKTKSFFDEPNFRTRMSRRVEQTFHSYVVTVQIREKSIYFINFVVNKQTMLWIYSSNKVTWLLDQSFISSNVLRKNINLRGKNNLYNYTITGEIAWEKYMIFIFKNSKCFMGLSDHVCFISNIT